MNAGKAKRHISRAVGLLNLGFGESGASISPDLLCGKAVDPEVAKALFHELMTFEELRDFMVWVVLGKMPSPIYDFRSVDEPNSDNTWWGDDAWKMLVAMNLRGFVTHEAEPCTQHRDKAIQKFQRKNKVRCRASVSGVMPYNRHARAFLREVNLEGMVAITFPFLENDVYDPPSIGRIPRSYMNDEVNANVVTAMPIETIAFGNKELERVIMQNCISVVIMDPKFGVPASERLFPTILRHLQRWPNLPPHGKS
jgi:hypothetical protein